MRYAAYRVSGLGRRVWESGFRGQGFVFWVPDLGSGGGFVIWGLGIRARAREAGSRRKIRETTKVEVAKRDTGRDSDLINKQRRVRCAQLLRATPVLGFRVWSLGFRVQGFGP